MIPPRLEEPRAAWWRGPLAVAVVVGALVAWRAVAGAGPEGGTSASSASPSSAEPSARPVVQAAPRCEEIAEGPFVLGDAPAAPKVTPTADPSALPDEPPEEINDPTAPFAVEVGRGAVFEGGFAVGARRDEKSGGVGMVATLGADGKNGKLVRLGKLRGDLDPPVVAGAGKAVLAVMIVPNAGGRTLKLAKVTGDEVTWGPELGEGRDDSMAMDLAASPQRAVIVWDDIIGTSKRSSVMLATLDVAGMRLASPARPVSGEMESAEHPRLVARPGGYWLAYIVRGVEAKGKGKGKPGARDDDEDRELGEAITTSFVELIPLDESGTPAGVGRAVTPSRGHVLAYDLELGDDGSALVAWRDDDTPTGSAGGRLFSAVVRLGGVGEPRPLAEETAGAGVPDLLPGWIILGSVSGSTRIAAMSPRGELLDELAPEKSLGAGVPIAAQKDAILWARPMGKAMRLSVVRCKAPGADAGAR